MNLHEYQAKRILSKYGIPIPPFRLIEEGDDAKSQLTFAFEEFGNQDVMIKAQVHAGGRGKVGGIKRASSLEEAQEAIKMMRGMQMITAQTSKAGIKVEKLIVTPRVRFEKENYLGIVIDRSRAQAVLIASPEGGIEIEEVFSKRPNAILKQPIALDGRLRSYQLWEIAKFMEWGPLHREAGMHLVRQMAKAFVELDATLLEINPLVLQEEGRIWALDAKLSIDDNALFRHHDLATSFDVHQISSLEAEARSYDLAYIGLEGEIGCMVNGAGLAMATMDIVEFYGGKPANFLDVGGGASAEKVAQGFKIILSDPHVKAILVNIFGGIMNCETLALGIIAACEKQALSLPLVVRMEGTNVEKGRALLKGSGLKIVITHSLDEAAKTVVREVQHAYSR